MAISGHLRTGPQQRRPGSILGERTKGVPYGVGCSRPCSGSPSEVARYDPSPGLTDTALGTEVTVSPDSRRVLITALPEWWVLDPDHPETTPFGTHCEFGLLAYDA